MKNTVYVLTNPSLENTVRIGNTTAEEASAHHPTPYNCYYEQTLSNADVTLPAIYTVMSQHRVNPDLDFFKVSPECAKEMIQTISGWHDKGITSPIKVEPVIVGDNSAEVIQAPHQFEIFFEEPVESIEESTSVATPAPAAVTAPNPSRKKVHRRKALSLYDLGMKKGDTIYSVYGHEAVVAGPKSVTYDKRTTSLTKLNKRLINKSRAYTNWKNKYGVILETAAEMQYDILGMPKP